MSYCLKLLMSVLWVFQIKLTNGLYVVFAVVLGLQVYRVVNLTKIPFFSLATQSLVVSCSLTELGLSLALSVLIFSGIPTWYISFLPFSLVLITLLTAKLSHRILSAVALVSVQPHRSIRTADPSNILTFCNLLSRYRDTIGFDKDGEQKSMSGRSEYLAGMVAILTHHGLSKCMVGYRMTRSRR